MRPHRSALIISMAAAILAAGCGGSSDGPDGRGADAVRTDLSGSRGALIAEPPPRITLLAAAAFNQSLGASSTGEALKTLAGEPRCDIALHKYEYSTVSGTGTPTRASGALMIPVASSNPGTQAAQCAGPRPMVLYAHGTTAERFYNIANIAESANGGNAEASVLAAFFAAQGFIVVAPNYAGYDSSDLDYHPYLNHDQQAKDMVDSLVAGRKALASLGQYQTIDSGKLMVTGFSQGGSVAMATQRELQRMNIPYTAGAPMSGAYAVKGFVDRIFQGGPEPRTPLGTPIPLGGPILGTMLIRSYQRSYGGLYSTPSEIFSSKFAAGIETLIPTATTTTSGLLNNVLLPAAALFAPDPLRGEDQISALIQQQAGVAIYDASNHLINATFRNAYNTGAPSTAVMRQRLEDNDLRLAGFIPARPTMLCAGRNDPTVFTAFNHDEMVNFYDGAGLITAGLITPVDVDPDTIDPGSPFAMLQGGFKQQKTLGTITTLNYHGNVLPFCAVAVRGFFQQVLAAQP